MILNLVTFIMLAGVINSNQQHLFILFLLLVLRLPLDFGKVRCFVYHRWCQKDKYERGYNNCAEKRGVM